MGIIMRNKTYKMTLVSLFAALTAIGALLKISTPLAPFTLQILFVILSGLLLGPKLGAFSQVIYIILGLVGVPVFSQGGGLGYIISPYFGYLLGFIATAFITGFISKKWAGKIPSFLKFSVSSFAGLMACYLIALPYMLIIFKFVTEVPKSFNFIILYGFLIYLPGDTIKIIIAAWLAVQIHKRILKNISDI